MAVSETIIPGGGGDFTSVEAWEATLLNESEDYTGVCTEAAKCNTGVCTLNASNSNAVRYTLTVAVGYRFWDVSGGSWPNAFAAMKEGAYLEHGTTQTVKLDGSRWTVEHLAILCSDTTVSMVVEQEDNSYTFFRFNLVGQDSSSTHATGGITYDGADAGNNVYHDNIFISCQYTMRLQTVSTVYVYNNTIFCSPSGTTRGIARVAGTITATNNLVIFANNGDFYNSVGGDYNVDDDGTAPGANSTKNITPSDALTDVVRGQENPLPLIGYDGDTTPPGADGSVDLVGVTRVDWHAGAIETVGGDPEVAAEDDVEFGDLANLPQIPVSAADTVIFIETIFYQGDFGKAGEDDVVFSDLASLEHEVNAAGQVTFSDSVRRSYDVAAEDDVEFSETNSVIRAKVVVAEDDVVFSETSSETVAINAVFSDDVSFSDAGANLPIEGCETNFVPSPTIPSDPDSVTAVYFTGPWATLAYSIKLTRPEFGDARRVRSRIVIHRTRAGERRVFRRTPAVKALNMHFVGMTRKKLLELESFLVNTAGEDIRFIDYNEHVWKGNILTDPVDLISQGLDQGEASIEFEGTVIST